MEHFAQDWRTKLHLEIKAEGKKKYNLFQSMFLKNNIFAWCTYCNDPSGNDREQGKKHDGSTSEHMTMGPKRC